MEIVDHCGADFIGQFKSSFNPVLTQYEKLLVDRLATWQIRGNRVQV
jgi:hypothetical protein